MAACFLWIRLPDSPVNVKVGSARFFFIVFYGRMPASTGKGRTNFYMNRQGGYRGIAVDESADRLTRTIRDFAEPLLADMGMELVDIQFRREGHGWVLRLFIDKEGGVAIDDCVAVSREVSAYLEVEDLISHAYHLEISSPGLERPLKKRADFDRFVGRLARIKVREPLGEQRVLIGTLRGLEDNAVLLELEKETVRIDLENIAKARLTL